MAEKPSKEIIKRQNERKVFSSKAAANGAKGEIRTQEWKALDRATAPPGLQEDGNYYFK